MSRYEPVPKSPEAKHYPDDEIDLRELFATLWAGKWIIILTTLIFAAGGVAYALYKPDIYQANALLAPAEGGNGSRLSGQLGSLASLAGVSIGEDSSSNTVIAKEVLQSRAFLADFIRRHKLEAPLMATEVWNMRQKEWVYDREIYNPETGEWGTDEDGESLQPTNWDLVKKFRENHLNISENKDNGMVTVSVKSLSPLAARQWTEWLVKDINEHMRAQDVEEAEASISYLESKLDETNIAGMQQVFYQLIENETRTVMLANAQREYVFKTVDPAVVPQEKIEPKRALIAIIATLLGGMISVFIVFIRAFIRTPVGRIEQSEIQHPKQS
ncbi:Wzz/FepE/Etk N-terminal domain-containing protein [Marinobacter salarius]|jgi:LPS O-antigen subunit length determinant protein (WzzB/FepE family)|uniref:Wzz/FepE/Etk N-terminal domain-containing protein n=1 Tax=Marinobacter salarius TaxID=1420917 RepID=UPI0022B091C3|nr:Wzz/FepE/Etk N-terminal domain-containing protein [Marinobacter salarius]MCZ4285712.1 Wzz/FepE/Etk N-terminal domain-containing protein [Marinobacter salarius]